MTRSRSHTETNEPRQIPECNNTIIIEDYEQGQLIATRLSQSELVLGFDTETTVPNARDPNTPASEISLIQMSNGKRTWLFRMGQIGQMPTALKRLLTVSVPVKVGIGLDNDFVRLERGYGFRPYGFIDLQLVALSLGHADVSFDGLCKWVGIPVSQGNSLHRGNWDRPTLSPKQVAYAAYDAMACVTIYRKIFGITREPLDPVEDYPSKTDKDQLIQWVKNEIEKSPNHRSLDSLITQAVNSYGPWRNRWVLTDRRHLITETLRQVGDFGNVGSRTKS